MDAAADSPLSGANIMYTLHFYAGSHGQNLRDKVSYALNKGRAIFVTEWGTTTSDGKGSIYPDATREWIGFLADQKISWCNWSLGDQREGSAALNPGANLKGGWSDDDLTASGKLVKSLLNTSE